LSEFLSWCQGVTRLRQHASDSVALRAIAQHYGIPTTLVDVTSSVEVAIFFASHGKAPDGSEHAVVYAWRSKELASVARLAMRRPVIESLWRLAAQSGFFLDLSGADDLENTPAESFEILCPRDALTCKLSPVDIYPIRKSELECVLDAYFHGRKAKQSYDGFEVLGKRKFRSYAMAFESSRLAVSDENLKAIAREWKVPTVPFERVRSSNTVIQLRADTPEAAEKSAALVAGTLPLFIEQGMLPSFEVHVFGDPKKNATVSSVLNHTYDGLMALPFTATERLGCILKCVAFLPTLHLPEVDVPLQDPFLRFRTLINDPIHIWFAADGGFPTASVVSKPTLISAINPSTVAELRPFFRRLADDDPLSLLCFSVDSLHTLDFGKLKTMFAMECIPSQFLERSQQELDWPSGSLAQMVFNPGALAFLTIAKYESEYPFCYEPDFQHTIFLFRGMTAYDLLGESMRCYQATQGGGPLFGVRFHGFQDFESLSDSPEAIDLAQNFIKAGGLSCVKAFSDVEKTDEIKSDSNNSSTCIPEEERSLGGFEIWSLSRSEWGEWSDNGMDYVRSRLAVFKKDLTLSHAITRVNLQRLIDANESSKIV